MSAPEANKKRDYSRYDQMSTAELEQLLRLDFQASEDGDSDLDCILYISGLLAKRQGPANPDAAWEQLQNKYLPYSNGRSLYDLGDGDSVQAPEAGQRSAFPTPVRRRRLRRLALLAAILTACLLGGIAAQAAGVDVLGAIARWTDETFQFVSLESGGGSASSQGQEDAGQPQSVLQTLGMDGMFPTWHPDGFAPGGIKITELNTKVCANMTFYGEDRTYSVWVDHFIQPNGNTGTFEKDSNPVEEYIHNGQVFYILSNLDTLTATTYDGEFMVSIAGALTLEEIKAVIDSIPNPLSTPER